VVRCSQNFKPGEAKDRAKGNVFDESPFMSFCKTTFRIGGEESEDFAFTIGQAASE
jgi:hypothetical protein